MAARLSRGAMAPRPFRVERKRRETVRHVDALAGARAAASSSDVAPGQFTMLYAFGVGEVPISVSGAAARPDDPRRRAGDPGALLLAPRHGDRRPRAVRNALARRARRRAATC